MSSKKTQTKPRDPTPYLAIKSSQRQMFTYGENKLLDQMTLEITEAWKKDIDKMRRNYNAVVNIVSETSENIKFINQLEDEFIKHATEMKKFFEKFKFVEQVNNAFVDLKDHFLKSKNDSNNELKRLEKSIDILTELVKRQSIEIMHMQMNKKKSFWKKLFKR